MNADYDLTIAELVNATLFERRMESDDTCFVSNRAGLELVMQSDAALPTIESVLQSVSENFSNSNEYQWPGLTYVLGAYLLISSKTNINRAIDFLRNLGPQLLASALGVVPIFFQKRGEEYNFAVAPPPDLLLFISELTESPDSRIAMAARRSLRFMH